ncbi:MAG: 23S rRNA (pseudouridine(1915)-N(3))-methyltransferase RlmH [Formosimonas sp.]
MLQLTLITVSHKQPAWVVDAFNEYVKRLPAREIKFECKEIKPEERAGTSIANAMALEAARISAALPKGAHVIALDERGVDLTSVGLAQRLKHWQEELSHVVLVVGGADGLTAEFKASCHGLIRLSSLTLPHGMVRVLLAEQIYRAYSINHNHPYHRA